MIEKRIEIGQKVAEIINGNFWCPDQEKETAPVRVYLPGKQGFVSIEEAGVNIDGVKRHIFQDVKESLVNAGYNVYRA